MERIITSSDFRRKITVKTMWQKPWIYFGVFFSLLVISVASYRYIPFVQDHAYYYVATYSAKIRNFLYPPGSKTFVPKGQNDPIAVGVSNTQTALAPTATSTPTPTDEPIISATPAPPTPSPTPTITPTPIPDKASVRGVVFQKQTFNNCGPASLATYLTFWDRPHTQKETEKILKPRREDRNVMPYEMLDYVQSQTDLIGFVRYGGRLDIIKKFIAAGIPVLIERGMDAPEGWMGHYGLVFAYDDNQGTMSIADTYYGNISIEYEEVMDYWTQFDNIYLVVFPSDRLEEVEGILGPQQDVIYNESYALDQITRRINSIEDQRQQFFAWYSRGSILVQMKDFGTAATSFDKAFEIYDKLEPADRPYRILWYQTGPFFAYYYMGRYTDTLNLALMTLDKGVNFLEESWVWAARASAALGDREKAIFYYRQALVYHPDWWVASDGLKALGEEP
ncbi:MAG TPA: C39 family peptidase [Anaerolineaceae bacterium]|nr:C39 family peptidase [Anaerolineaceae bacterium]